MKVRDLDELLGTPARIAILASLAGKGPLTFTALKEETGLADGNLHVQTKKLLAADYLAAGKVRQGKRPVTCFRLTDQGRSALHRHVRQLKRALADPGEKEGDAPGALHRDAGGKDPSRVW